MGEDRMFVILFPERRKVTAAQLIVWASDDIDNGLSEGPKPTTVGEAIEILNDTGSVTLAEDR